LSPGPLHWGAPAWSDGPGVKLLVPRSRTDLPGVKSLAARRQDRETGSDCLGPKLQASSIKHQASSNKQLLLLVHYHKRQAIYPAPTPTTVQGYRILKDLSRKLFSLIHKKRFDMRPVIGYYRIISPLPCRAIQNFNRA